MVNGFVSSRFAVPPVAISGTQCAVSDETGGAERMRVGGAGAACWVVTPEGQRTSRLFSGLVSGEPKKQVALDWL